MMHESYNMSPYMVSKELTFSYNNCNTGRYKLQQQTMKQRNHTDEWVDKLKDLLLNNAMKHFEYKETSMEGFTAFLQTKAFIPRWDNFIEAIYDEYLAKVSETGVSLEKKLSN